jgi:ribosomal protein S18 acetylase RimI-like enzyme
MLYPVNRRSEVTGESISLRPVTEDDRDFLCRVYSSTRKEELSLVDWDEQQKASFLFMQFSAQHTCYSEHYPGAQFDIILVNGRPAGRLYVDRRASEIRVVDISLLPEYRNRGIGSSLLRELFDEGRQRAVPVTIHVECFNPAQRLYNRLGFEHVATHGVYHLMSRAPERTGSLAPMPGVEIISVAK